MDKSKHVIYLDYNSTTPIDDRVLSSMMPFLTSEFANANSTHHFGLNSYESVKSARLQVSELIGAEPNEIFFTSGSTEAINLAIKGAAEGSSNKGKHIVTISTEHLAVLDTCKYLESKGYEVSYLSVKNDGLIDLMELESMIREDTILVVAMIANNETGVILPIKEIAEIAHSKESLFMTDATQAIGKIPVSVDSLGIDLLCMSGHKLYAPKGIGALYVRHRFNRVKITPIIHGGGHEKGLRSGTLNVPGIVALGTACLLAKTEMNQNENKVRQLRDYLESELLKISGTSINGNKDYRLYNTSNILFNGVDSDALILGLSSPKNSTPEIAISNGSACSSQKIEPSHVLLAMGLSEIEAFSSVRFSLGKFNSKEEIEITIANVKSVVKELRSYSMN